MPKTLAVGQADIGAALTDFWRSVLLFIPRAIAFIVILVVGWLIARAVLKIVDAALERVGFDRAVERGGIRRARTHQVRRERHPGQVGLRTTRFYSISLTQPHSLLYSPAM